MGITINLISTRRPKFYIPTSRPNIQASCILDTGANISVWTKSLTALEYLFNSKERVNNVTRSEYTTKVGGFCGESDIVPVYKISNININGIVIRFLYLVILENNKIGADLVLASNVFEKCSTVLELSKKNLLINSKSNIIQMKCRQDGDNAIAEALSQQELEVAEQFNKVFSS